MSNMSAEQFLRQVDVQRLGVGVALLFLAAAYSPISLLVLSPVYGSLPSHIFHGYGVTIFGAAGWFLKDQIQRRLGRVGGYMLPVLAFWVPTLQYFVMQQGSKLGTLRIQVGLNLESQGDLVVEHVPMLGTYMVYSAGEHIARAILSWMIGFTFFFTRTGLQYLIAVFYSATLPSKWLVLAIPSLLMSMTFNVHLGSPAAANHAIQSEGYTLLARQDSSTGYISVLENQHDGFRVMRCDHSLLGGQWTKTARGYRPEVDDPIYAVFAMLEAVRLVEPDHGAPRVDAHSNALVIGLGIGTTPSALIKHGIETTVVELDPVVHRFATEYFNLPSNHIAAIEDATKFVKRSQASAKAPRYDYIVHDVFTGGTEPAELFTIEFLRGLSSLLKDDGVIAINYAGDITLYPTGLIVRTIQTVFPSCRIFREEPPTEEDQDANFTNMVLFCKKSAGKLRFRDPVQEDYLRSKSRESYLVPKHELNPALFATVPKNGRHCLIAKEVKRLHKFQDRGALEHWAIMRKVLPDAVWENW
ncbi:Spermine/spermidine synthase family protein [Penicillium alfredii]|uniref:Spermine/spermidine synthase family protein n=1 Tax=Penicillium alfredii TaxID=1506179 RepID=A0A9W9FR51_9EURO|nr:Spermine/spermidine synthase family protein [Penicillium alfredii]KAJ5104901.1 Spermine/spermidine synthase family protein [Penicillium alfredii]